VPAELGHISSFGDGVLHWVVNEKWGCSYGGKRWVVRSLVCSLVAWEVWEASR
jgi:hypothetical protein